MIKREHCGNCTYLFYGEDIVPLVPERICKRYPPKTNFFGYSKQPEVTADDWCGEWKES